MLNSIKKGIKWSAIQQWVVAGMNISTTLILSSKLNPEDFGIYTKATVLISFLIIVQEMGINSLIIKRKNLKSHEISAIRNFLIITSIVLFILFFYLSKPILNILFSGNSVVTYHLATVMLISILLENAFLIYRALLVKEMKFNILAKNNIIGHLSGNLSALIFVKFFGIWVLPLKQILTLFVSGVLNWYGYNKKIKIVYKVYNIFLEKNYLIGLSFSQVLTYLTRNIDYIIIGRYLGPDLLGQYSIAYRIMMFPMKKFSDLIGRAIFPALSIVSNDLKAIKEYYFETVFYISLVTIPLMVFIASYSNVIVNIFFDKQKWFLLDQIILFLSITGIFQSLCSPLGYLYRLTDNTKKLFYVTCIVTSITGLIFFLGVKVGLVETIIVYMISNVLFIFPLSNIIIFRDFDLSFFDFLKKISHPFIVCFVLGIVMSTIQYYFNIDWTIYSLLSVCIIYTYLYIISMSYLGTSIFKIFNSIIKS